MKIVLTERLQRDIGALSEPEKEQLFTVILKLPAVLKDPHKHSGIGLRKIHPSGIFEARLGLALRLLFGFRQNELILHRVGSHEEIRRYLKDL